MRFLLGPLGTDGGGDPDALDELADLAVVAEHSGFDGVVVAEGRLPEADGWAAPYTILMRLAHRTTAIRLGALCALEITNPIYLAEEAAVLDAISTGRAFMMTRRASDDELRRLADITDRAGRYEEALEILLRSWAPPAFAFDGQHWTVPGRSDRNTFAAGVEKASVTPKPLQLIMPTWLLVESGRPSDVDVAARFDLPTAFGPGALPPVGPGSLARPTVAVRDLHLHADGDRARKEAAPVLAARHDDDEIAASAIVGDVDEVISQLRELAAGGVGMVACRPLWPSRDAEASAAMLRFFGEAVIPEFRMDAFPEEIRIREPQGGNS